MTAVGALPQRGASRQPDRGGDRGERSAQRRPANARAQSRATWQCPTCKTTNPAECGGCPAAGFDRFRKKRDDRASDKENDPKAANAGRKKPQNAADSPPALTTAQLSIVQKAGLATYQEAMLYEDLSRVPRTDEKALTEAFRATIESKIRDRVSIIQSKERARDDCVADYNALASLNFVKMLLEPMRNQIADCRSTLGKAEDELYGILVERRKLTARETHQRQVIGYYSQLPRELEQLRG